MAFYIIKKIYELQSGGYLQVKYNLGSRDHHLGYFNVFVNDGRFHFVKLIRNYSNMTLMLDDNMPIKYTPKGIKKFFIY